MRGWATTGPRGERPFEPIEAEARPEARRPAGHGAQRVLILGINLGLGQMLPHSNCNFIL